MNNSNSTNVAYHGTEWAKGMAYDIKQATQSIHLTALSIHRPTKNGRGAWPDLINAWKAAALQGVRIDLWLPAPSHTHPATLQNMTVGKYLSDQGLNIHLVKPTKLLHAKTCVIDRRIVWIGSGNFTAAAAHHNHEAYMRAECPKIAEELITRWCLLT